MSRIGPGVHYANFPLAPFDHVAMQHEYDVLRTAYSTEPNQLRDPKTWQEFQVFLWNSVMHSQDAEQKWLSNELDYIKRFFRFRVERHPDQTIYFTGSVMRHIGFGLLPEETS